jgi:hypothetical protein
MQVLSRLPIVIPLSVCIYFHVYVSLFLTNNYAVRSVGGAGPQRHVLKPFLLYCKTLHSSAVYTLSECRYQSAAAKLTALHWFNAEIPWEANQEIPHLFWNWKVHCRVSNSSYLSLSWARWIHTHPRYSVRFALILYDLSLRSPSSFLPSVFFNQNFVCIFHLFYACLKDRNMHFACGQAEE